MRKDYEKMLTQLEELSKQENYQQMYTNVSGLYHAILSVNNQILFYVFL